MATNKTNEPVQLQLFDLSGRRALVVGLGQSGLAMARWAMLRGAKVIVADTREQPALLPTLREELPEVGFIAGPLLESLLEETEVVLWSPGLSTESGESADFYAAALERSIPILGEIELFAQALAAMREQDYQPRVLAITGTNGKTTTARLLGHLCERAGLSVIVAGNIAPAALDALRIAIEQDALPQVWVLELSSFQLTVTESLAPDVAAILNVTQDHLDWHASMQHYLDAKQRIYRGAAVCVFNRDDPATRPRRDAKLASFGTAAPAEDGDFGIALDGGLRWLAQAAPAEEPIGRRRKEPVAIMVKRLMPAEALLLRGTHNQLNVLAALAMASAIGVPMARMLHALRDFEGEAHRCQLVASINEVEYYDDSKGTNVGATVAALAGLGKRCVLIAGGEGKGQDFSPLMGTVRSHARAVLLIGRDAPMIQDAIAASGVPVEQCESLQAAVARAAQLATARDAVLLSPACASFDMFRNYGHRGEVFVEAVKDLALEAGIPC
jgi:UDP-N-acetylmuramoylalanine--D-glutamate ligase